MVKFRSFFFALVLSLGGCATGPIPKWKGKIWAGSSGVSGIERRQEKELIHCLDPAFDRYLCISYEDFLNNYRCLKNDSQGQEVGAILKELKEPLNE